MDTETKELIQLLEKRLRRYTADDKIDYNEAIAISNLLLILDPLHNQEHYNAEKGFERFIEKYANVKFDKK